MVRWMWPRVTTTLAGGALTVGLVLGAVAVAAPVVAQDGSPSTVQAGSSEWQETLGATIRSAMTQLRIPGLAIAVVRDGGVAYEQGFGTARGDGTKATPTTPFVLASVSKALTGLAVERLIADGQLNLDETLAQALPDLDLGPLAPVTLRQVLGHESGLSRSTGSANWVDDGGGPDALERNAERIARDGLASVPGSGFVYSNANYDLLGAVVERATGQPFADAMQALVFDPLGMTSASADVPDAAERAAMSEGWYDWLDVLSQPTAMPYPASAVPSSFIRASVHDLAQEMSAMVGDATTPVGSAMPITAEELLAARSPLSTVDDVTGYAMGWYVHPAGVLMTDGETVAQLPAIAEHDGSSNVTDSYVGFIPDRGLGIAYVANTGDEYGHAAWDALPTQLWAAILGTPPSDPGPDADPVRSHAKLIYLLTTLGLLIMVALGLWALRARGRRGLRVVLIVLTSVVAAGVAWLALGYAPSTADSTLATLMRWDPDLGLLTVLVVLLAGIWVVALAAVGVRRLVRRRAPAVTG